MASSGQRSFCFWDFPVTWRAALFGFEREKIEATVYKERLGLEYDMSFFIKQQCLVIGKLLWCKKNNTLRGMSV